MVWYGADALVARGAGGRKPRPRQERDQEANADAEASSHGTLRGMGENSPTLGSSEDAEPLPSLSTQPGAIRFQRPCHRPSTAILGPNPALQWSP